MKLVASLVILGQELLKMATGGKEPSTLGAS